jgi:hypothetical protein
LATIALLIENTYATRRRSGLPEPSTSSPRSTSTSRSGQPARALPRDAPGFVDTPTAEWSGIRGDEMIQPEDCAEVVRMCLRLSPHARIPQVVIERMGSRSGDVPLSGA